MAGTVMPYAKLQFFDDSGDPLNGGLLYTYAAGTDTPLATYTTSALAVANPNPVVLDSAGRCTVYLSATSFKFVLKTSAGVTVWTQDNVSAVPLSSANVDVDGVAGETITANQAVYLSVGLGSTTAGRWYLTDADNSYSSAGATLTGIAVADIASSGTGTIRVRGRATGLSGLSAGSAYYASATAGALTATAPAHAYRVGIADSSTTLQLAPSPPRALIVGFGDAAGAALTSGAKAYVYMPFSATIVGWTLVADASGSVVIDVWKDTYANAPPTVADTIAGTEKPTLASAQKNQDTSLSSWTTAIAAGDVLGFNVDSATTVKQVTLVLHLVLA